MNRDEVVAKVAMGPVPLALLRLGVGWSVLTLPEVWAAPEMASWPMTQAPGGWSVVVGPAGARVCQLLVVVGATLGLSGIWAQAGFGAVALGGLFLLGIPEQVGAVRHYHHLLWFSALLAVSPCADALTVRRWQPAEGRSLGWGVPVIAAWALISLIFFFPGLQKVWSSGLGWAGEPLRRQMLWKWAESWAFEPLFRLDRWPRLLQAGGLGVLALELLFPVALLHRWSRLGAAAGALLFHAATALFFDIHFAALWLCYGVFAPVWGEDKFAAEVRSPWPAAVVGGVLIIGMAGPGLSGQTQSWPFACYPTFDGDPGLTMPTVALVAVDSSGVEREIPERALAEAHQSQTFYGEIWAVSGLYGPLDPRAVEGWVRRVEGRAAVRAAAGEAAAWRVYRATRSVEVDGEGVVRGALLWEGPRR